MRTAQDKLIDKKFNLLECIGNFRFIRENNSSGSIRLWCDWKCDCGTKCKSIMWKSVVNGNTKSCGCLKLNLNSRSWTRSKSPPERTYKDLFNRHKKSAKSRGLEPLDYNEWRSVVINNCFYCGSSPPVKNIFSSPKLRRDFQGDEDEIETYNAIANGVDRYFLIDTYKGNSVPCCKICNVMKGEMTPENFFSHINHIVDTSLNKIPATLLSDWYFSEKDVPEANFQTRLVLQIDKFGNVLNTWHSIRDCAKYLRDEIGIKSSFHTLERIIGKVCRGELISCYDLYFCYSDNLGEMSKEPPRCKEYITKPVLLTDGNKKVLKRWSSIKDCAADFSSIEFGNQESIAELVSRVCKGAKKTWRGLHFSFSDSFDFSEEKYLQTQNKSLIELIPPESGRFVEQFDSNGNVIQRWNCKVDCATYFLSKGIGSGQKPNEQAIGRVCLGRQKHWKNMNFRYAI